MFSTRCKLLLDWYGEHGRDLPWRQTHDPYRIWVSEIMLQQTQVKTVLPRYPGWFDQFPDIRSLADASLDDVLKRWEGLGYYRRARLMHQTSRQIVSVHDGKFPAAFDAIMALPGIGRSTAGAIDSFCFAANTPVLDGNVKRVLKRWHGKLNLADKALWQLAQQGIDTSGQPANWNQAMMELGATVCAAKSADCNACPVQTYCASAFQVDYSAESRRSAPARHVHWQVQIHRCPQKGIWLRQRPASGIWAGLWTPPIIELEGAPDSAPAHIHQLTHRRIHLYPLLTDATPAGAGRWVRCIESYALPTGIHRLFEKTDFKLR